MCVCGHFLVLLKKSCTTRDALQSCKWLGKLPIPLRIFGPSTQSLLAVYDCIWLYCTLLPTLVTQKSFCRTHPAMFLEHMFVPLLLKLNHASSYKQYFFNLTRDYFIQTATFVWEQPEVMSLEILPMYSLMQVLRIGMKSWNLWIASIATSFNKLHAAEYLV